MKVSICDLFVSQTPVLLFSFPRATTFINSIWQIVSLSFSAPLSVACESEFVRVLLWSANESPTNKLPTGSQARLIGWCLAKR